MKAKQVFEAPKELLSSLAGLLCACVAVDAYFIGCELLTTAYNGTDAGNAVLSTLLTGGTAPFFWFELVCGLIVPFCILVWGKNRRNMRLVAVASTLVVLGVFCKRVWLMFTGFATPAIVAGNGITLGTNAAQTGNAADVWSVLGTYMPTAPEVVICIAIFALAGAAIMALSAALIKREA